ncbi:GTA head formation protein, RCAP_rcc01685 family [Primorskyibacter sp. S87]|uniref:GTA head formation protein, RCAP_rcc01685 family n=1 Tax=Primorskyibacter sp. S87 TaxID=3415126 RepID=UPI003C7B799D
MTDGPDYVAFDCAPGLKLAAHERVAAIQHDHLCRRLDQLQEMMERQERRLWLTVYGVAAAILGQLFQGLMTVSP